MYYTWKINEKDFNNPNSSFSQHLPGATDIVVALNGEQVPGPWLSIIMVSYHCKKCYCDNKRY